MKPSERLAELNLTLPAIAAPVGSYIPANLSGPYVFTSGQLAFQNGKLQYAGRVPDVVSLQDAKQAAEIAGLNALAAVAQIAGGIDNIARIVRVCVYVNSSPDFGDQPKVANGASDLYGRIFGEAGRHARSAVGASGLPMNACVEVELMVELAP